MSYAQAAEEITGWMSPQELQWLREKAKVVSSVVEIGSWKGRSSWALLESCPGPVYCVDSWQGADDGNVGAYQELEMGIDVHKLFLDNVGHFPNLRVVRGRSDEVYHKVPDEIGFVFIDADHSFIGCLDDLRFYGPKARVTLAGHDYSWDGVKRALGHCFSNVLVTNPVGDIWQAHVDLPWSRPRAGI